LKKANKYS